MELSPDRATDRAVRQSRRLVGGDPEHGELAEKNPSDDSQRVNRREQVLGTGKQSTGHAHSGSSGGSSAAKHGHGGRSKSPTTNKTNQPPALPGTSGDLSGGRQLKGGRRAPSSHTRKKVKLSDHGEAGIPEGSEPLVDPDILDSEFRDEPLISNEADSSVCSEYIQFKRTRRSAKNKRSTGMENNLQGEVNPLNGYRISAINEKILFEQSETEKNTWELNLHEVLISREAKGLPLHRPPQNRWRLVGNRYIQLSKSQLNRVLSETKQNGTEGQLVFINRFTRNGSIKSC